jgi:hypothetical protein
MHLKMTAMCTENDTHPQAEQPVYWHIHTNQEPPEHSRNGNQQYYDRVKTEFK